MPPKIRLDLKKLTILWPYGVVQPNIVQASVEINPQKKRQLNIWSVNSPLKKIISIPIKPSQIRGLSHGIYFSLHKDAKKSSATQAVYDIKAPPSAFVKSIIGYLEQQNRSVLCVNAKGAYRRLPLQPLESVDHDPTKIIIASIADSDKPAAGAFIVSTLDTMPRLTANCFAAAALHGARIGFSLALQQEATYWATHPHKTLPTVTDLNFVTIDPSKNGIFRDQAICIKNLGDKYAVYYAVTDMSCLIPKGSLVEQEILERGEAMYPPLKIPDDLGPGFPIMPKTIGIAGSLNPGNTSSAFILEFIIDKATQQIIGHPNLIRSRIKSVYAFNFAELDYFFEHHKKGRLLSKEISSATAHIACIHEVTPAIATYMHGIHKKIRDHISDYRSMLENSERSVATSSLDINSMHAQSSLFSMFFNHTCAKILCEQNIYSIYRASFKNTEDFRQAINKITNIPHIWKYGISREEYLNMLYPLIEHNKIAQGIYNAILAQLHGAFYTIFPLKHHELKADCAVRATCALRSSASLIVQQQLAAIAEEIDIPYQNLTDNILLQATVNLNNAQQRNKVAHQEILKTKILSLKKKEGRTLQGTAFNQIGRKIYQVRLDEPFYFTIDVKNKHDAIIEFGKTYQIEIEHVNTTTSIIVAHFQQTI